MSSVILYNSTDSTVPGRVTDYLLRANTPDYETNPNALINPDLSLVTGIEQRFWKVSDSTVIPMSTSDKSSMLPGIKIDHKTYLQNQAHSVIGLQYGIVEQSAINSIFTDTQRGRVKRNQFYQDWANWLGKVETEIYNKTSLVNDKTSVEDVENIAIDTTSLISLDPKIKVENGIGISDSSSLVSFLDANASVTDASTGIIGPYYLMELLNHRKELYNDSTNPLYDSNHTPILGSGGILIDYVNRISSLETIHQKMGWHEQEVEKGYWTRPKDLLVYYGWLNSFNSDVNSWNNEKVAQDMAKYNLVVFGDGIEAPSHGDYANTQVIIPRIKALNPTSQLFGYIAANTTFSDFTNKALQWNTLGVQGIFMDQAGYDFGLTRSQFNQRVDYVHSDSTSKLCFVNAWNTDHVLGTANDVSYPNSTYNPGLVASKLQITDWIMLESFPVNTTSYSGGYESGSDWAARGSKMSLLRAAYGVNFAAVSMVDNTRTDGTALCGFAFSSAMQWSLEGFGTSDTAYGASSAKVKYWPRPDVKMGQTWNLNPSIQVDAADSSTYHRYVEDGKISLSFTAGSQSYSVSKWYSTGATGIQGVTGLQGATGLRGQTGIQGVTGIVSYSIEGPSQQRVFMSMLAPGSAGFLLISGTAYFVYLGKVATDFTPKYVEFHVSSGGGGSQTAEVGFFSSTNPPNKGNLSLSKIVATGTVDALNSTGVKRNTSAFSTAVSAGTHLWAGIRTALVSSQPTIWGLSIDMAQGQILSTAASGALTGTGPWTGAIITASTSVICPDLRGTLD